MEFESNRRVTLGPVNQSTLNMRANQPGRISTAADTSIMKPARMSIGAPANRILGSQPSQGGKRTSIGPGIAASRKSSLPQRTSSMNGSRVTDPRNLSDKHFLNDSIRTLTNYLSEHGFDHSVSSKILSRPSNKDFSNIALFLFRQYDPNYTLTGKFEDEVAAMLKQMGYPCQISKANISAAGTPHAWPSLLAALVWIVELLQYDEALGPAGFGTSPSDPSADVDDRASSQRAFYQYLAQAYALFMQGEDDRYADLEQKFVSSWEARNLMISDDLVAAEQRTLLLQGEIEAVERRRSLLPELEKRRQDKQQELANRQFQIEQQQRQKVQLQSKVQARQAELERLITAQSAISDEISSLRHTVATQELSPDDIRRMNEQRDQFEQAHAQAAEARRMTQDKVRSLESDLRARVEALAESARTYTQVAEDLKLVPSTARNARGKNLELELDVRAKRREDLLRTDVRLEVLPPLQAVRRELSECTHGLKAELMSNRESFEEGEAAVVEAQEKKISAESRLKRVEETYRREKDAHELADQAMCEELEAMESRLSIVRDNAGDESRAAQASRRVEEAKTNRANKLAEHERRRSELMEAIMDVVAQCANHREMAQQKLRALRDAYASRLEDCLFQRGPTGALKEAARVASAPAQVPANSTCIVHMSANSIASSGTPVPGARSAQSTPQNYTKSFISNTPAKAGAHMTASESAPMPESPRLPKHFHSSSEQKQHSAKTSSTASVLISNEPQPILLSLLQGQEPSILHAQAQSYSKAAEPVHTASSQYQEFMQLQNDDEDDDGSSFGRLENDCNYSRMLEESAYGVQDKSYAQSQFRLLGVSRSPMPQSHTHAKGDWNV